MKYTIQELAAVVHVESNQLTDGGALVSSLLTDSRSLTYPRETLFVALRTHNADGHQYVQPLFDQGVRNFVVDSLDYVPREIERRANFLIVPDTLDALQAIAEYHRRRFDIPVIGITGSRGKTTVKEWLYQLLKDDYHIVRSPRSYNSQIGVPLSLWDIDDQCQLAIIEAGISTVGEMSRLQAMIRPTMGIITNIGSEHNDGFKSMEEKAREKSLILSSCESIVYPADDPLVTATIAPLIEADVAQEVAWSRHDDTRALYIKSVETDVHSTVIAYRAGKTVGEIEVPFTTERDIENVITCLAVVTHMGMAPDVIASRMAQLTPVGTRINVIEGVNDCTLIVDGYTSDYNSLTPAIDFMRRRSGSLHNTVILSDLMPESFSDDELYIRISELLKTKRIERLIGVGPDFMRYGRYFASLPKSRFFPSTTALLNALAQGDFDDETILIKGAPEYEFSQIVDMLEAKRHQTVEEVDLSAVAHNFKFFKSFLRKDTLTVGMVKANGYGTGAYEVARTLQEHGADYLAVAVQDEGVDLRRAGITMPIIVLNPSVVNYKAMFTHHLEPEVYSLEECRQLITEGEHYGIKHFPVHVKADTGMHRLGFTLAQLPELIDVLSSQDVLSPASVFTHLCVADEPAKDDFTRQQFELFDEFADKLQSAFPHRILRHALNTAGIVRFPEHQLDMVRMGIGLYGVRTLDDGSEDTLRTVASLHSVVISIKEWPAGTAIGYGRKGLLDHDARIATLTIGYGDGLDRHFGNGRTSFWLNGALCPTVGNVCMDAVMIDVTGVDCHVGDRVEIFGEHVPIEQLAATRGTIGYEILTSVAPRVKRVYYRE